MYIRANGTICPFGGFYPNFRVCLRQDWTFSLSKLRSAKADPVRFKWGFGEGLLKDFCLPFSRLL